MTNQVTETAPSISFEAALERFMVLAQGVVNAHYASSFPELAPTLLKVDNVGPKYVRISATTDGGEGQTSSYCFIEKGSGNVLKSASWKAPAKGARGNIYAANPVAGVSAYGALYLR